MSLSTLSLSTGTGPGLKLSGREVTAALHLLVVSFLEPSELVALRGVSRGWGQTAETALTRLENYAIERRTSDAALQWCHRLRTLRDPAEMFPDPVPNLARLISQNSATLTAVHIPARSFSRDVWRAVCGCRSLRCLTPGKHLSGDDTAQLVASFPHLEELYGYFDWSVLLSAASRPPLKRLEGSASLSASLFSQLVPTIQDLEALSIAPAMIPLPTLFASLSTLPRLAHLQFESLGNEGAAPSQGHPRPELKALRSLSLRNGEAGFGVAELVRYMSAPGLQELATGMGVRAPFTVLLQEFPGLTSLTVESPRQDGGEDLKAAIAVLQSSEQKRWTRLARVRLDSVPGSAYDAAFMTQLGGEGRLPALTDLEVTHAHISPRQLEQLLQAFPGLKSLTLRNVLGELIGRDEVAAAAAGWEMAAASLTHGLTALDLGQVHPDTISALASAFRFPRLRAFRLEVAGYALLNEEVGECGNLMPLLLYARETLLEVSLFGKGVYLAFPPGTVGTAFPRLQKVGLYGCRADEDVRRALTPML